LVDNVPNRRIVGLQGSARSGKTYSILQYLISLAFKYHIGIISICRESYNALKATAMRDFFDILIQAELYDENNYHKTDHIYNLNGNIFEFFGLDSAGKVQGRKRNILFVNEIMEVEEKIYRQLAIRTIDKIIYDYNPTEVEHYVYGENSRDDASFLISTYKDNHYLNQDIITEIEYLKHADPMLWRIYGEGLPASIINQIYSHWIKKNYEHPSEFCYGLDFGFQHPSALIEVGHVGEFIQWHELIYQTKLTIPDLIQLMNEKGINKSVMIYADGARPEAIEDIKRAGYRIKATEKYAGSVKEQIMKVKSKPLIITSDSINLLREVKSYKWSENKPDEPIKAFDDGMDAGRYGTHGLVKSKIIGAKFTFA
jgi:phage terminase large subunit